MGRAVRIVLVLVLLLAVFGLGGGAAYYLLRPAPHTVPDGPIVVERMREVARLETLDVSLHEVIHFQPDPTQRDSFVGTALEWAKYELFPKKGTVVVFAEAHVGLDLSHLGPDDLRIDGKRVTVRLPPLQTQVELNPDQVLVVDSNLSSQQTMQLLDVAKRRFQAKLLQDARLKDRARASSERALRALLITLGYTDVVFVDHLPPVLTPG